MKDPRVLERDGLQEIGLGDRGEELFEPPVLVHALVGAGPRAELLAVIRVHDEARALVGPRAQLLHRLPDVAERDQVAELHAAREHDHGEPLILGDIRFAELLRTQSRLEEMLVVEDRVRDASLGEQRGKMRFPHALGQPCAQRPLTEDRVNPIGQGTDLTDAVPARHTNEDGLVIAAGEELDLSASHQVGEISDHVGPVRLQPVQERTGEVKACLHLRVAVKRRHERRIRALGHLLKD